MIKSEKTMKSTSNRLGCTEQCIGGELEDKLEHIEKLKLWLELVNHGPRDLSPLASYNVKVKTVQAHHLHELHWLSTKQETRKAAYKHVAESIKVAEEVGAKYVLTVPTYGYNHIEKPEVECIKNYKKLASETTLTLLIEALSPRQTSFMPSLPAVGQLVYEINVDNVALAADTWHIKESGFDVAETVSRWTGEIIELHLKDDGAKPPGTGSMDFDKILTACSPELRCMEYREGTREDLTRAWKHLTTKEQSR